ncbi:MAG: MBL fold metallo-hydrolase [Oscillospiraceae bacterium]|nr:MBL fold metallo-hydrolase [Oscillospiraceae bacterium]
MADKRVYKSGKNNPNAYLPKGNIKRFITVSIILLVIIFTFTVEYLDKKNGDAWKNTYKNTGVIENYPDAAASELSVYFLDVDQSDCSIVMNSGKVLMIDTGTPDQTVKIREALQSLGITKIDYLLITHQHDDHMGGAVTVLENYEVSNIIMPKLSQENMVTTRAYEALLNTIKEKQVHAIAAEPNLTFNLENAKCTVLAPLSQDKNLNNMSAVTKITFGSTSFLFQGDAEKKVESAILSSGVDVSADVIKVGHHGSKTSSSKSYINAVSPKVAIISCGMQNSYGHPHEVTLETLQKAGIDTYITYQYKTLCVKSDGKTITVLDSSEVIKTYE